MTMREIYVVYCPDCQTEIDRCLQEATAEFESYRHHHEEDGNHEPGIITGHYPLWEVDDGE